MSLIMKALLAATALAGGGAIAAAIEPAAGDTEVETLCSRLNDNPETPCTTEGKTIKLTITTITAENVAAPVFLNAARAIAQKEICRRPGVGSPIASGWVIEVWGGGVLLVTCDKDTIATGPAAEGVPVMPDFLLDLTIENLNTAYGYTNAVIRVNNRALTPVNRARVECAFLDASGKAVRTEWNFVEAIPADGFVYEELSVNNEGIPAIHSVSCRVGGVR